MTRAAWAERKVNTACNKFINTYPIKPWTHYAAQTLLAEHKRAVRAVKAEMKRVKLSQNEFTPTQKMCVEDTLDRLLAALQRGRE